MGAHEVGLGGFLLCRGKRHGIIEERHDMWERVAEETRDPDGDVDAGPSQFFQGNRLQPDHPAGLLLPDGTDAEQREHLGDVITGGAHRRGSPHGQANGTRVLTGLIQVPGDEVLGCGLAGLPRQPRRDRLRVDGVEIAASRKHVHQAAQRRARRSGRDIAAVEGVQHRRDLTRGLTQPRHHLGGPELQGGTHPGYIHVLTPGQRRDDAVDGGHIPVSRGELLHEAAGLGLHPVGVLPRD